MSPTSYQAAPPRVSSCRITGNPRESSQTEARNAPSPRGVSYGVGADPRLAALARDDRAWFRISASPHPRTSANMRRLLALSLLVPFAVSAAQSGGTPAKAELPRATVDTKYPSGGRAVR